MELRIEFTKGVGDLQFGQSISQVTELIGEPTETEQIGEDMEMPTTVLHYTETGLSLFFDKTYMVSRYISPDSCKLTVKPPIQIIFKSNQFYQSLKSE